MVPLVILSLTISVSVVCSILITTLCITEIMQYLTVDIRSNMLVDVSHREDILHINIDIFFPKMACDIITLDVEDVMGTHVVDVQGQLFKRRISKDGEFLSETNMFDNFVTI